MRLYEFEGKKLFRKAGIPTPDGTVVSSADEIDELELPVVIKAQVLSGGRGKEGLIKPCKSLDEVKLVATELLGKEVNGEKIEKVLIESYLIDKAAEYYLAITYDTSSRSPIALVSKKTQIDNKN